MASNFRLDELIRRYPPREKKQKKATKGSAAATYQQQLCWDCASACGGCSWSREGKPVPGWEAEQTSILCCTGRQAVRTESYKINFCPEFRRG